VTAFGPNGEFSISTAVPGVPWPDHSIGRGAQRKWDLRGAPLGCAAWDKPPKGGKDS